MFRDNLYGITNNWSPSDYSRDNINWIIDNSFPSLLPWSRDEDKLFEEALVLVPEGTPDRWRIIADKVPGRAPLEVEEHYEVLLHDLIGIIEGRVELPCYKVVELGSVTSQITSPASNSRKTECGRKRGIPWTKEEHRLFLLGLEKYGKGHWRNISRNVVVSRTPTQVASHAQKYFQRLISEKKRPSIHDITTNDDPTLLVPSGNSIQQVMGPPRSLPGQSYTLVNDDHKTTIDDPTLLMPSGNAIPQAMGPPRFLPHQQDHEMTADDDPTLADIFNKQWGPPRYLPRI